MKHILLSLLMFVGSAGAMDNSIYIDQAGSYNSVNISQDGSGHVAAVALGTKLPAGTWYWTRGTTTGTPLAVDNNTVNITQDGIGFKTANVELVRGYNNGITIMQNDTGNHQANIKGLSGDANNITINQTGGGNHIANIKNGAGAVNSGDTINITQEGNGDKKFNLFLNGSTGATVTVQQTNPTQANTGSMTIQCVTCGAYSYIRQ